MFERRGADLRAVLEITLAEALCGFSRVVLQHLDGRGIQIQHPKQDRQVLEPGQVIEIKGEGMPIKKSESRGNLYLTTHVKFPDYAWLEKNQALSTLENILPKPEPPAKVDVVDEVEYELSSIEAAEDGTNGEEGWEDDDDEDGGDGMGGAQCQQQ